jgi:hypothetical protein
MNELKLGSQTTGILTQKQTRVRNQSRPIHLRFAEASSRNPNTEGVGFAVDPHVEALVLQVLASVGLLKVQRPEGQPPYVAEEDRAYIHQRLEGLRRPTLQ